jgi:hypothetical protein
MNAEPRGAYRPAVRPGGTKTDRFAEKREAIADIRLSDSSCALVFGVAVLAFERALQPIGHAVDGADQPLFDLNQRLGRHVVSRDLHPEVVMFLVHVV